MILQREEKGGITGRSKKKKRERVVGSTEEIEGIMSWVW
jgi:hypothetical protein